MSDNGGWAATNFHCAVLVSETLSPLPGSSSLFVDFAQTRCFAPGPWHDSQATLISLHRVRSEEHTSELQSLMRISYAVFCLKKKTNKIKYTVQISHKQIVIQ